MEFRNNILVRFPEDGIFFVCEKNRRNYKVVQGQVKVKWSDGHFYNAEILALGNKHDLILILNSLSRNVPFICIGKYI